ncbi:MAG: hypothetical protein U9N14_05705 [Pseudomonadota bacterium]|nr:hypothetical protein [Pseudomonadota bacterium]
MFLLVEEIVIGEYADRIIDVMFTDCRLNEIMKLHWDYVDLDHG